jgi:hypothetical protein
MKTKLSFLNSMLFFVVVLSLASCVSKQKNVVVPVPVWEDTADNSVVMDIPPKEGFVPAPPSYQPIDYPEARTVKPEIVPRVKYTYQLDNPPSPATVPPPVLVYPVVEASPHLPIATLMNMYYQEFKTDLWLMTQLPVRTDQFSTSLFNGSILIDKNLNAAAIHDNKYVQIEVVWQVKEEKRLVVYYFYRSYGGAQAPAAPLQYYRLDLTSQALFYLIQQKRQGALGFEINVVEVPLTDIAGFR